ncbi:spermidine synthase [Emiliania huxleyi CCMP1516]|uniref:PABS domain-containing protein n=3 Tax=Emiliania huxleyi TaxID=2903 RepID=A0A0D3IXI0_EMIH1|nr:spermidine synthase [Emiliania huxleyi CCMP1516]EOD15965.1 spermidine synthase [Emiliania huxleyi CCMP1516]|eukprot:XP_005768394.1 spermidine synthase [Emiliania huxleyi CCMP1516]
MPRRPPTTRARKLLHAVTTTVTGSRLTVEDDGGLRTLALNGHCQSEVRLLADGTLSLAQPLELVQAMSLLSLAWLGLGPCSASPRVLLLGLGGGSIARVLCAAEAACHVHSVDIDPEVITAAAKYFGLALGESRCTAEPGDSAAVLRRERERAEADGGGEATRRPFDVVILDAFDANGLCRSTQEGSTLDDAKAILGPRGLLLVNLHTGDREDPDYYVCRRLLRRLAARFGCVYTLECESTQNLIAVCHDGEMRELDEWHAQLLDAVRSRPEARAACGAFGLEAAMERFHFVGGRDEPLSEDDDEARQREARVMSGGLRPYGYGDLVRTIRDTGERER